MASGVYIHIPYCRSKCKYCAFVSKTDLSTRVEYVEAVKEEMRRRLNGQVDTIYLGGGTPSMLHSGGIADLIGEVRTHAEVTKDCEITVECNPDSVTAAFVDECVVSGVNRVSIGLQTTDDRLLTRIGRPHTFAQFVHAIDILKTAGMNNISVDLMLGLPDQSMSDIDRDLSIIRSLPISHLSVYSLKVEPGTRLYQEGYAVDENMQADMYERVCELVKGDFVRYEVSNFARDGKISRHNYKYWTMCDYYGFGVAAHSYINGHRISNTTCIDEYLSGKFAIEITDVRDDFVEEAVMLGLRTTRGLDTDFLLERRGYDIRIDKREVIDKYVSMGMLIDDGKFLRLTDRAFYVMNRIIVDLI